MFKRAATYLVAGAVTLAAVGPLMTVAVRSESVTGGGTVSETETETESEYLDISAAVSAETGTDSETDVPEFDAEQAAETVETEEVVASETAETGAITEETEAPAETELQTESESETEVPGESEAQTESEVQTEEADETELQSESEADSEAESETENTRNDRNENLEDDTLHTVEDSSEADTSIIGFTVDPSKYPAADVTENTKLIYRYLTEEIGFNHAAACGILANIQMESGFSPLALGDSGSSYGLCQWHAGRFNSLISYCNSNSLDYNTLEGQLAYLAYDLDHSYASVKEHLMDVEDTAQGAYDAAYYWCMYFEAPAQTKACAQQRGNMAMNEFYPEDFLIEGSASGLAEGLQADEDGNVYYEVQSGDYLIQIADRYDLDANELADLNGISDPNEIAPGDKIYTGGIYIEETEEGSESGETEAETKSDGAEADAAAEESEAAETESITVRFAETEEFEMNAENSGSEDVETESAWYYDDDGELLDGLQLDENGNVFYEVQHGDWLIKIADQYGFELEELIQKNTISNPDLIITGELIYFPDVPAM